ncbi:MAG: hypothetical protein IPF69_12910 [Chitinophagaceae bacterium]|nr:hypothetical protein [Chitinophagaceae bacterium]
MNNPILFHFTSEIQVGFSQRRSKEYRERDDTDWAMNADEYINKEDLTCKKYEERSFSSLSFEGEVSLWIIGIFSGEVERQC